MKNTAPTNILGYGIQENDQPATRNTLQDHKIPFEAKSIIRIAER